MESVFRQITGIIDLIPLESVFRQITGIIELIPFQFIAELCISNKFILWFCGVIIVWAVFAYLRLKRRLDPLLKELGKAADFIEQMKEESSFEELDEHIQSFPQISPRWKGFQDTLIFPEPGEEEKIYRTQSANACFPHMALLRINVRLYNALPNLFTGAGILGTFMGLVAGIYLASGSLADTDPFKAQAALKNLLGGASLAFITSITGLLTSIVFSIREKKHINRFEIKRKEFVDALDRQFSLITQEKIFWKGLSENREQTKVLSDFTEHLAYQLTAVFENTFSKVMDEKVGTPLIRAIEGLQESLRNITETHLQSSEDTLWEIVNRFQETFYETAGREMQDFSQTIQTASQELKEQITLMETMQKEMQTRSEESASGISNSLSEFQKILIYTGKVLKYQRNLIQEQNEMAASVKESAGAFQNASEKGNESAGMIAESSNQIKEAFSKFQETQDRIAEVWADYQKRFVSVDNSLSNTFRELDEGMQRYAGMSREFFQDLDTHTSEITGKLAGAIRELQDTIEDLDETFQQKKN